MTVIDSALLEDNKSNVLAARLASSNNKFLYEFLVCKGNKLLYEFAKLFNLCPMELIAKNKCSEICSVRQLYCKYRYEVHKRSFIEIASEINRSPATVRSGVYSINGLIDIGYEETLRMWNKVEDNKDILQDIRPPVLS